MNEHINPVNLKGREFYSIIDICQGKLYAKQLYILSQFNENLCLVSNYVVQRGPSKLLVTAELDMAIAVYNRTNVDHV